MSCCPHQLACLTSPKRAPSPWIICALHALFALSACCPPARLLLSPNRVLADLPLLHFTANRPEDSCEAKCVRLDIDSASECEKARNDDHTVDVWWHWEDQGERSAGCGGHTRERRSPTLPSPYPTSLPLRLLASLRRYLMRCQARSHQVVGRQLHGLGSIRHHPLAAPPLPLRALALLQHGVQLPSGRGVQRLVPQRGRRVPRRFRGGPRPRVGRWGLGGTGGGRAEEGGGRAEGGDWGECGCHLTPSPSATA